MTSLWAGSTRGVANLGADDPWHVDATSTSFRADRLWEAPDGTLSVASNVGFALRRRDSTGRHIDDSDGAAATSDFVGRSSRDVYVAINPGPQVLRWNGAGWSSVADLPCTGRYVTIPAIALTASHLVIQCNDMNILSSAWRFDGATWARGPRGFLVQGGTPAAPEAYSLSTTSSTTEASVGTDAG